MVVCVPGSLGVRGVREPLREKQPVLCPLCVSSHSPLLLRGPTPVCLSEGQVWGQDVRNPKNKVGVGAAPPSWWGSLLPLNCCHLASDSEFCHYPHHSPAASSPRLAPGM